jgi:hypothetical protein
MFLPERASVEYFPRIGAESLHPSNNFLRTFSSCIKYIRFGMQQCHGGTLCLKFVTSRRYCGNIDETDFGTYERGGCCYYSGFCFAAIGGIEDL